jgi:hypothetical protein
VNFLSFHEKNRHYKILPSISPFPPPKFYSRFLYRDLRCFKFKILTHTHPAYTQISEFDFVKIAAQVEKSESMEGQTPKGVIT